VLQCVEGFCDVLRSGAEVWAVHVCCSVLQCVAVCCSVCYSVLQRLYDILSPLDLELRCGRYMCVSVCRSVS